MGLNPCDGDAAFTGEEPVTGQGRAHAMLALNVLGELEIRRNGERLALPQSKKTRALLAYLAVTSRAQRRERLCRMFWERPDDPRGALRWSLSKIRPLLDEPGQPRIIADRESVELRGAGVELDLAVIQQIAASDPKTVPLETLETAARQFRGEFLEGLELPDLHEFQSWCVAEREEVRNLQARILRQLLERLQADPETALPYARSLARIEPYSEAVRATLVRLLGETRRHGEAEQQWQLGNRLLREAGIAPDGTLRRAWEAAQLRPAATQPELRAEPQLQKAGSIEKSPTAPRSLIGRQAELDRMRQVLGRVRDTKTVRVLVIRGEPGIGKTRMLAEFMRMAKEQAVLALSGVAHEAERGRPYGPWSDALKALDRQAKLDLAESELSLLLPGFSKERHGAPNREALFNAVAMLIGSATEVHNAVVLAFDDMQWCDEASASLLHYAIRENRRNALLVVLTAREGELPDNDAVSAVLRSLRRGGMVDEIDLQPLAPGETAELVRAAASEVDPSWVHQWSSGNPLFALELAYSGITSSSDLPRSLTALVQDRLHMLPIDASDMLRWAAVVGQQFDVRLIQLLAEADLSNVLCNAELLERYGLIAVSADPSDDGGGTYMFAHELVRHVIYSSISEPRRRLMHNRISAVLRNRDDYEANAAEVVHHAALAGDFSSAARACLLAGRNCLRVFANVEAQAFANRGMHYAGGIPEPERVRLLIELMQVSVAAARPVDVAETARQVQALAERALDANCHEHARLGFHMLSYLRWEIGEWSEAERQMLRAELVSRTTDERERVIGMAEAARCLALLERDLPLAEALAMEASALSHRMGLDRGAVADATGMIRLHQGQLDEAAVLFREARFLAAQNNDHIGEFYALEHSIMLEFQRRNFREARAMCDEIVRIGQKLRGGSEAPFAGALCCLARIGLGDRQAEDDLHVVLQELRAIDAKHRLLFVLTRGAELLSGLRKLAAAQRLAEEALEITARLGKPSETALAHALLARLSRLQSDREAEARHMAALREADLSGVSQYARDHASRLFFEAEA